MITYAYRAIDLDDEIELAKSLGARVLEILPGWSGLPDPVMLADRVQSAGLSVQALMAAGVASPSAPRASIWARLTRTPNRNRSTT